MRRESVISVGLALASHAVVLFGVPATLLRPAVKSPAPAYVEVSLAAAPDMPVAESKPQVSQPPPLPDVKPPPPKPEPQQPEPVVTPPKPDDFTLPESTPVEPPPAPPRQGAATSAPASTTASLPAEGAQTIGSSAVTNPPSISDEYHLLNQPYYVKRGQARYPLQAKKLRQEGTVVLSLYINAFGRLDKIEIRESSGFPLLDEAAIAAERQSRFCPAYIGNRPVPSRAEVPYRFQLQSN